VTANVADDHFANLVDDHFANVADDHFSPVVVVGVTAPARISFVP